MAEDAKIPLADFQKWMQHMLLDPHGQTQTDPELILPEAFRGQGLSSVINDSNRLAASEHLAIYQRSYIARLRDCMAKQFSALEYALGKELFCGFADNYLELYPSKSYNLIHLGQHFADYLEDTRPDKDADVKEEWPDFMIELAHFEYASTVIFDEEAEEDFVLATEVTSEHNMYLIPVFYAFRFRFPVRWFYSEFIHGRNPGLPRPQDTFCAIVRRNFKLALFDLNEGQYQLLTLLESGISLSAAKEKLFDYKHFDRAGFEKVWPVWKKRWLALGFFFALEG